MIKVSLEQKEKPHETRTCGKGFLSSFHTAASFRAKSWKKRKLCNLLLIFWVLTACQWLVGSGTSLKLVHIAINFHPNRIKQWWNIGSEIKMPHKLMLMEKNLKSSESTRLTAGKYLFSFKKPSSLLQQHWFLSQYKFTMVNNAFSLPFLDHFSSFHSLL